MNTVNKHAKQMEWNDRFRRFDGMDLLLHGLTPDVQDMKLGCYRRE